MTSFAALMLGLVIAQACLAAGQPGIDASRTRKTGSWNHSAAAQYLDSRELWWQTWPPAQRDHGTTCVSCHTVLPYALSRPALRADLGEEASQAEQTMIANVEKRVALWNETSPFYQDAKDGAGKSVESRSTEAVVNTLILAAHDAQYGHLREITTKAFNNAWTLQLKGGDPAGAWSWQVFHLAPWESEESQYQGAAFMALAVGLAPDHYRDDPKIQSNLEALSSYLERHSAQQPLLNQLVLLWASAKIPGLVTTPERASLQQQLVALQQADGGWRLAALGSWHRGDGSELPAESDGYATAVAVLALEETGGHPASVKRGVAWLVAHQDRTAGSWRASSLNKQRDPASDVGRFMNDAATGYAVLALEKSQHPLAP